MNGLFSIFRWGRREGAGGKGQRKGVVSASVVRAGFTAETQSLLRQGYAGRGRGGVGMRIEDWGLRIGGRGKREAGLGLREAGGCRLQAQPEAEAGVEGLDVGFAQAAGDFADQPGFDGGQLSLHRTGHGQTALLPLFQRSTLAERKSTQPPTSPFRNSHFEIRNSNSEFRIPNSEFHFPKIHLPTPPRLCVSAVKSC
ncbi:MAG: hypothetical protein EBV34_19300 [Betaproteobacteria bacterium]|nr:hypothetical protein [Betaproteobacteria bacterium]